MAVFNPNVPQGKDEMPNWTKVTNPISSFEGDKSTGIALATLGKGIDSASDIVEFTAKDIINKDVRSTVEPIREDYTNQLLATKAMIQGADNAVPPMDLMHERAHNTNTGQSVPAGIDAGLNKVDRIQNMLKFGSGKLGVDDTYYDMRLKTAVVDLRTKYPGFVDYIDQRVSAITGMNPANETINDLTRQISQLQSTRKTEFDKTLDMARKAIGDGLMGAKEMKDYLVNNGQNGVSAWENWYYQENRKRAVFEEQDRTRKAMDADKKEIKEKRTGDWTNEVGGAVSSAMNTFVTITGMNEKKSLLGFIQDANDNPGKYSAEQLKELGQKFQQQRATIDYQLASRRAQTFQDDKGRTYSYNSDVGAPEAETIQKNVLAYYDQIDKALTDKNVGLAFSHANRAAGMLDTDRLKIYSGPLGENMRKFRILNDDFGSNWGSVANTQLIKNSVDKTIDGLFENTVLAAKAGEKKPDGTALTYKGMADEALSLKQKGQINDRIRSRYLQGGLNIFVEDITNPTAPIQGKLNALKFFFSPEGQGVLQHFSNDQRDYSTNPPTIKPGRQTVWNQLTSDAVVNEVKKLSELDPGIGNMYRQWTEREAGAQLYIKDLKALNGFIGTDDVHVKYYDGEPKGTPYIQLIDKEGQPLKNIGMDTTSRRYYQHMQETVGRVNEALAGMDRVTKGLGVGNASDNLLGFLMTSQVEVGEWKGIPKQLIEAIAAARGKGKLKDVMEQGVTK